MTQGIVIDEAAWTEMIGHAEACYPEESCGVLLGAFGGDGWRVHSAAACVNQACGDRHTSFHIDAEQVLEASREGREAGLEIAGFYHSHPGRAPYFSIRDVEECWPGCANIVLAVEKGRFREARAYASDATRTLAGVRELSIFLTSGRSGKNPAP